MDEKIIKMATWLAKTSHMRSGKSEGCVFEVWNRSCKEKKKRKQKQTKKTLLLMPHVQINHGEEKAVQD